MDRICVENQIQLADILEALVQGLYKDLDQVENPKLRFWRVNAEDEIQCRVVPVDEFVVWSSNKAEKRN